MRVVVLSDHLERRETAARQAVRRAETASVQRPKGIFRRLWWWVTGRAKKLQAAREADIARLASEAARLTQGRGGEISFVEALGAQLDDHYVLLQGFTPPEPWRSGGDIDGLLIGPHGVTVIEVKTWKGFYRYSGHEWLFRKNRREEWETARKNPTEQALANLQRIRELLASISLGYVPVRVVIAVAADTMNVEVHPPVDVPLYLAYHPHARLDTVLGPRQESADLTNFQLDKLYTTLLGSAARRLKV
jgi:nuclease-like protein